MSTENKTEFVLTAVGDVRPTRATISQFAGGNSPLRSHLRGGAFFGNLEIVLGREGLPASKLVVARAGPEAVEALRSLGLTLVSLANNHAFDFGLAGLTETCRLLRETGIPYVGVGANEAEAWAPAFLSCNGLRLALLAVATTVPPGAAARGSGPGMAALKVETAYRIDPSLLHEQPGTPPYVHTWMPAEEIERLQEAAADARKVADVVVVSIHWGVGHEDEPAQYQRQVAKALAEAGVCLVLGHHPHQLQGLGVEGKTYVIYSLGDFLRQFRRPAHIRLPGSVLIDELKARRSLVVRAHIGRAGVEKLEVVPVFLDDAGEPQIASGDTEKAILEWLGQLSTPLGGRLQRLPEGGALLLPANQAEAGGSTS